MGKYLTGSAKTGEKIMKNISEFSYELKDIDDSLEKPLYCFEWQFNSQYGSVRIMLEQASKKISNSSLIDTDDKSGHRFGRPLGLYNDKSLFDVFKMMMNSQNINIVGTYAE